MFKEIRSMVALKVKWNNERIEELSNKTISIPSNFSSPKMGPANEVVRKQIEKFLPFSPEKRGPSIKELNFQKLPSPSTSKNLTSYVFEQQYNVEGKIAVVIKERNRFGSSAIKLDQPDNLTMRNLLLEKVNSNTAKTQRIEEKLITIKENRNQDIFSRGKLPSFYITKGEGNLKEDIHKLANLFDNKTKTRKKSPENNKSSGTVRTSSIQILKQKVVEQKSNDVGGPRTARRPSIELDARFDQSLLQNKSIEKTKVHPTFTSLGTSNTIDKTSQKLKIVLSLKSNKKKQQQSTATSKTNISSLELTKIKSLDSNGKDETTKLNHSRNSFGFFSHGNLSTREKSFTIKTTRNHTRMKSLNNLLPLTVNTKFDPKDLIESEIFKGFKILGPRISQEKIMVIPKVQSIRMFPVSSVHN